MPSNPEAGKLGFDAPHAGVFVNNSGGTFSAGAPTAKLLLVNERTFLAEVWSDPIPTDSHVEAFNLTSGVRVQAALGAEQNVGQGVALTVNAGYLEVAGATDRVVAYADEARQTPVGETAPILVTLA
ncbi:hypothetical protein [Aliagarivorans taiwanensis]|uniref:hypothetical protein n=1 Tax=Aliagarivorans taiwanensis TaxID=561966 RepID=UPI0012F797ED|nr:hypothetical protein [Aliagarivorans taiwanensis]